MNYASTSNIREVIKFYNLGDKTFETDSSEDALRWPTMDGTYLEVLDCLGATLVDLLVGVMDDESSKTVIFAPRARVDEAVGLCYRQET